MKSYPTGIIVQDIIYETKLLDTLKDIIEKGPHKGDYAEILMKLGSTATAKAHYEDADIPLGQRVSFVKMLVPFKEMIANAAVTMQARMAVTGDDRSWGNIVELAIKDLKADMSYLANLAAIGDGTAALARVVSKSGTGTERVLTCDNTYSDFGWENTSLLRPNMLVDVYTAAGVLCISGGQVTAVAPGKRVQTGGWLATTGAVTVVGTWAVEPDDNGLVYVHGSRIPIGGDYWTVTGRGLPMGLKGIVSDGLAGGGTGTYGPAKFQNLVRSSPYKALWGRMYAAAPPAGNTWVVGFGVASETPAYGTPTLWDLSVIDSVITDIKLGDGNGKPDTILCHTELAAALGRKTKDHNNVVVNVRTTDAQLPAADVRIPAVYRDPDGDSLKIITSGTIPKWCMYLLSSDDLMWVSPEGGAFDFLRETGDIWEIERGSRKTHFEAPYYGCYQLAARRCDNCAVIMDMRTDA